MSLKKFIVEMGMGIDQHGQDLTNAAPKAVGDAIPGKCLWGLVEVARLDTIDQIDRMIVRVEWLVRLHTSSIEETHVWRQK